ncbi:hypothetical protein CALCODRAFT_119085 [Calocera cornea HHB12733]|uniref:F-box domain-containing protein n=1 Tax=Calocera cornea HHB12733 TaxID=1353952 RepID=A0A165IE10_9BASI|nr:hypothetical protein CALCODRAFT_119085 [Calocera cornea HHB12733]
MHELAVTRLGDEGYDRTRQDIHPLRLDALPYDVLASIASQLPNCASLASLAVVSPAFTQPAQSSLFRLLPSLNPRQTLYAFLALQRKPELARVVKRVRLNVCEADELLDSFGLLPAAWLRLVWRTIRKMSSLQQLGISTEERKSIPYDLPELWDLRNLERSNLHLKSCKLRLPAAHPIEFLRQQTSLEELSLHMLRGSGHELYTNACTRLAILGQERDALPKLKALQAPVWVADRLLGERRIERLNIKGFLIHPDEVMLLSRPHAGVLKVINLAYLALRPEVLIWIGENLRALEELRLTVLLHPAQDLMKTLTSPSILSALSNLNNLHSLCILLINCHLHHRERNYAEEVQELGNGCKALKEVNLCLGVGEPVKWKREGGAQWGEVTSDRAELTRWDGCWPNPTF